jgi:HD-like signal output (HDOD) protein
MLDTIKRNNQEMQLACSRLKRDLDELVNLRPMPNVALRLLAACREAQPNIKEIVELIECDPVIAVRVLAIANSALYGYSRQIGTLSQAVVVLGFKNLSLLAVMLSTGEVYKQGEVARKPRRELYEHSLACATVARLLSPMDATIDSGAAFLAGMLHDVGKLILIDLAPNSYAELKAEMQATSSVLVEDQHFGMDHTAIGRFYGEHWGLPYNINQAIAEHHLPMDQIDQSLSTITRMANLLTKKWGLGQEGEAESETDYVPDWLSSVDEAMIDRTREAAATQFELIKSLCN